MGKLILISGESGSGKSRYAEEIAAHTKGQRFYIATMLSQTEENQVRIEKHIRQREGLGFQTLELPYRVGDAPITGDACVLLEDVSNLLANVIFEKGMDGGEVLGDIRRLLERSRVLIAVTIAGLSPEGYEGETARYIEGLNRLNEQLWERAEVCVTMKDGHPSVTKGALGYADESFFCGDIHI